jgi:hypothetical protein
LTIEQEPNGGWYICEDVNLCFGPYKRERDAKGALTRLKNKHIG